MNSEQRICQNCKQSFIIESEDFMFYEKMKVPPPTWCPECTNVSFSLNLQNCMDCFGCVNLKNKQHCIFNEQYTKEEYEQKMKEFDFGSYSFVQEMKKKVSELSLKYPRRYVEGLNNEQVVGDYIFNSKNVAQCTEVTDCENCKPPIEISKVLPMYASCT
ncbi:hypothetical protein HY623_03435 [Candidatus Uhrbacteria bacterium]|nr:hypothetical protein [Candidatus Uhrbacteria bacterium]